MSLSSLSYALSVTSWFLSSFSLPTAPSFLFNPHCYDHNNEVDHNDVKFDFHIEFYNYSQNYNIMIATYQNYFE